MSNITGGLKTALTVLPDRLKSLSAEKASHKPAPDKWSAKEELGHLLDSAVMNHARFVRVQLEKEPILNGYDGDAWVAMHRYQDWKWEDVIDTWHKLNSHLLAAVERTPEQAWQRRCTSPDGPVVTLQFLFEDYVHHAFEHLEHIGVETSDLRRHAPVDKG